MPNSGKKLRKRRKYFFLRRKYGYNISSEAYTQRMQAGRKQQRLVNAKLKTSFGSSSLIQSGEMLCI
jgi:hypothetical protein